MISKLQRLAKFSARYAEDFWDEMTDLANQALQSGLKDEGEIENFVRQRRRLSEGRFVEEEGVGTAVYLLGGFFTQDGNLAVRFNPDLKQNIVRKNQTEGFSIGERFTELNGYVGGVFAGISIIGAKPKHVIRFHYGKGSSKPADIVAYTVKMCDLDEVFRAGGLSPTGIKYSIITS